MLRLLIAAAMAALIYAAPASAQTTMENTDAMKEVTGSPDYRATMAKVGEALERLAETNARMMNATSASDIIGLFNETLLIVEDLRKFLFDNPYIRIGGFSIGIPTGASIDFVFPN